MLYLHVMLDADGDGRVTPEEFIKAAKECREATARLADSQEVQTALYKISSFLKRDPVSDL